MKIYPHLSIYFDPSIPISEVKKVAKALEEKTPLKIMGFSELPLPRFAYNNFRNQYNGQKLLNRCIETYKIAPFLWLVAGDLYVPPMNFIFGLATEGFGGIVSFFRMPSLEMKIKESLHETGHILGLSHCTNQCVMQFSNSLQEALDKPSEFCSKCKIKLNKLFNAKIK